MLCEQDDGERPATATNIQANIYDQCNDPQGAACAKPVPVVSGRWPGEQSPPVYFQATDEDDIGPMLSNNKFLQQKLAKQSET
jgi:hypothetical protein